MEDTILKSIYTICSYICIRQECEEKEKGAGEREGYIGWEGGERGKSSLAFLVILT